MDAALADYIKQFAAGALEFAADTENEGHGSIAPDGSIVPDDASSADTVGAPSPTSFYKTASASSPRDARRAGAVEGSPRPGTAKRPTPSAARRATVEWRFRVMQRKTFTRCPPSQLLDRQAIGRV